MTDLLCAACWPAAAAPGSAAWGLRQWIEAAWWPPRWSALALVSLAEAALVRADLVRMRQLADEGSRAARLVQRLGRAPPADAGRADHRAQRGGDRGLRAGGPPHRWPSLGARWLPLTAAGMIVFILVICEITPKTYAVLHAERVALLAAAPVAALTAALRPLVALLNAMARGMMRAAAAARAGRPARAVAPAFTDDEIKALVVAGEESGELEPGRRR